MEARGDIHLSTRGIVSLAIEGSRSSPIKRHEASLVSQIAEEDVRGGYSRGPVEDVSARSRFGDREGGGAAAPSYQ